MLMWLSAQLVSFDAGFAVFQYLTLRGNSCRIYCAGDLHGCRTFVIERLNRLQIGQTIRAEGPQLILRKPVRPPWAAR